jgi:hypothetical protein
VGPRAVLDAVVKRNIPSPRRESNHRTPIVLFPAFYGTQKFITMFTRTFLLDPILSPTNPVHSFPPYLFLSSFLILSYHLLIGLPSCLFSIVGTKFGPFSTHIIVSLSRFS